MTEIVNYRPRGRASTALAAVVVAAAVLPALATSNAVAATTTVSSPASFPIKYETSNLLVSKTGRWVRRNANGASQGNALVTDGTKKQALTLDFTGSAVAVDYCNGPLDGYFSVYVDGRQVTKVNSYNAVTSCRRAIFVNGLLNGSHRLVVQASAKRGSKRGTSQVVVDYFSTH